MVDIAAGPVLPSGEFGPLSARELTISLHPVFGGLDTALLSFQAFGFSRGQLIGLDSLLDTLLLLEFPILNSRVIDIPCGHR